MQTKYLLILLYLITFILFFLKGTFFLDPDFGWHLKMGELILNSGIPQTDPFSYTMPNYPFVDHEWLTEVILFRLHQLFGYQALALIFAVVAVLALLISIPPKVKILVSAPFLVLAVPTLLFFAGIRLQVISWLFFAVLLKVISEQKLWSKFKYFLPFLFLLWVNLHGYFALGIVLLGVFVFFQIWQTKKVIFSNLWLFLSCLAVTFVNPYAHRIWWEIWNTSSDTSLRWKILEWMPMLTQFDPAFIFLTSLSAGLVIFSYKTADRFQIFIFSLFLLAGVTTQRNTPFWVIITLPLGIKLFSLLHQKIIKNKDSSWRFNRVYKIGMLVILAVFFIQLYLIWGQILNFKQENYYPQKAVNYLNHNLPEGEIFAPYEWGGYLIWKLPQKKVFIDGRMPSWKRKIDGKEFSIYDQYNSIARENKDFKPIFDENNIKTVLWPVKYYKNSPEKNFEQSLKNSEWKEVYKDEVAIIYQNPETKIK